ncbi:MAG: hypothetical protein CMLOHMNK_00746 [Steroidobacteraceae bacterium]|nr:hypothetical protein [Steroidobacteraceae bacterium]
MLNTVAMVANHFIAARVSPEMKVRIKALANQRQLSESALLKQLLVVTLDGAAVPRLGHACRVRQVSRDARLYVRLRPDDQLLLAARAAARGMPPATYVSVLVRSHLRHLSPLPKEELLALKGAITELGAIGRNLNQIIHTMRQGGSAAGPRREDVMAMIKVCTGLRDHFKATLLANLRSWEDGYDSSGT